MIWRNGRRRPAGSLVVMQSSNTPSSPALHADAGPRQRAIAFASWRLLWVLPVAGWVLALPDSPAKWPALALLAASALVLHADTIARPIRRLAGRA